MTQATEGMNLEDIILSEVNQVQKDTPCWLPVTQGPRALRFISRMSGTGGREDEDLGFTG